MCLRKKCIYIELIEIRDGVKIALHYDKANEVIFIQYMEDDKEDAKDFISKADLVVRRFFCSVCSD